MRRSPLRWRNWSRRTNRLIPARDSRDFASCAEPDVVHGQRAEAEFCDEHGASSVEAIDDCGVLVEFLVFRSRRAPCGGITLDREQILAAPGEPVQRAAIFSCGEIGVGFLGFCEGAVFGERDDEVKRRIVALEAIEIHFGERHRGDFLGADEFAELASAGEADVFQIFGNVAGGDGWSGGNQIGRFSVSNLVMARQGRSTTPARRCWRCEVCRFPRSL